MNTQNQPDEKDGKRRDWRKEKQEKKAKKMKYQEDKMIHKLEKVKEIQKKEMERKRKLDEEEVTHKQQGRTYTVSIALPGSILDNAQSPELRTYLAGQIARAAVIFNVDEIIVFDETGSTERSVEGEYDGVGRKGHANVQLARILQYLECPQYLRKSFFPQHRDLQYAGLLNPLDCGHHLREHDESVYREGVVLNKPVKPGKGSFVDIGLRKEAQIDKHIQPGVRVTVKLNEEQNSMKKLKGVVVSPSAPCTQAGLYWGYTVRIARSLSAVFTEGPHKGGYDLTIGTSERGADAATSSNKPYSHALIVFGGVSGLEASLDADEDLHVEDPSLLFHHYLNTCPSQGSRTIRTEEAILITMSVLSPKLKSFNTDSHENNEDV